MAHDPFREARATKATLRADTSQVSAEAGSRPSAALAASAVLAATITKSASRQTYYTIRWLVDRPCVDDAYRAYAYFRWVDDILDAAALPGAHWRETDRARSLDFIDRQRALLRACLHGEAPRNVDSFESMLVHLLGDPDQVGGGLATYVEQMMRVMEFDAERRGRRISREELDAYTRWLAIAVTEAVSHFIGGDRTTPHDQGRYHAAAGAHILHMLRDMHDDLRAGYVNIPQDVLGGRPIEPRDLETEAVRAWVHGRVELARAHLTAGHEYLARVSNRRHRLAGLAYMARFEWLIPRLERDAYVIRPWYGEATVGAGVGAALRTLAATAAPIVIDRPATSALAARHRRP